MQAITNPTAIELSNEIKRTVAPNDFVNATLDRKSEMEELRDYIVKTISYNEQKAKKAAEKAVAEAAAEAAKSS